MTPDLPLNFCILSDMGNSSTSHLSTGLSCIDANISRDCITNEYWDQASINHDFKVASIVLATIVLIFLIIGLPSNVILIISIIKHLKLPTYILLLNLAIADVLVCAMFMPFPIVSGYAGGFIFGNSDKVRCQVCQLGIVYTGLSIASLNLLALISLDRFLYIKFPLKYYSYVTPKRTLFSVIIAWLFSTVQAILPLIGFGEIRYTYSVCFCLVYFIDSTHGTNNIYYILLLVILSLLPIIVIIVTNIWILIIVRQHLKKLYKIRKSFGNKRELQNHRRTMKREIIKTKNKKQVALLRVFGTILSANVITWLPTVILAFATLIRDEWPLGIYIFVFLTFISNSIIHPIVEGYLIPELKTSFKKILCPCKKGHIVANIDTMDDKKGWSSGWCGRCLDICSFAVLPESGNVKDSSAD